MKNQKYVQVGAAAMRNPDGSFMPAVPIFIREEDAGEINPNTGNPMGLDLAFEDIARKLLPDFKEYISSDENLKKVFEKEGKE